MKAVLLLSLVLVVIATLPVSTQGAFCTYYRDSNMVTCGSVTCTTAEPKWYDLTSSKLPKGHYRIGSLYTHKGVPWFNLYRKRSDGKYWDYYTKVPELSCSGGFGLHAGTISQGCITVPGSHCFNRLSNEITSKYSTKSFTVYECLRCLFGSCWSGEGTLQRHYTADLKCI